MRKPLVIIGSGLVLAVGALAAALLLVDINQFRGPIQSQLEKSLHRKVSLGNMGLKFIPLSIRIDDFTIAEDPAFDTARPFLTAKNLFVRASVIPLLQKRIEVQSAVLDSPAAELIKNRDGKWNFSTLADTPDSGNTQTNTAFSLGKLRVMNGAVAVSDRQHATPRAVYDRIALRLSGYKPGSRFTAEGSAHLPGKNKEDVAFKVEGPTGGTVLDGNFILDGVSAGPAALSGTGTVTGRGDTFSVKSSLKAVQSGLKTPVQIESTVQYDRASGKADIAPLEIRAGKLVVRGSASAETAATPVTFRADLRSDNAPLADLTALAHEFQIAQGVTGTGNASFNIHVQAGPALAYTGTFSTLDASIVPSAGSKPLQVQTANIRITSSEPIAGAITAAKLTYDQTALSDVSSDFKFANGVLRLDPIRARAFGGEVNGMASVDTRGSASKIAASAKLSGVEAKQLLAATTAVNDVSGTLSGDLDLQFDSPAGQNPARSLGGSVRLLLTNGRVPGIHLLDQLAQVGKFVGFTKTAGTGYTSIPKLAGTVRIVSGVARTDDLQLEFDGGSLTATGAADLVAETLDLNVAALLNGNVSQQVGGSKVGGFMTTVAQNAKGELMIPAKVTGSFAKPRFQPDPSRLAKMRFGSVDKAASTAQGILDRVTKPDAAGKAKPFTDLLKSFGKKK